MMGNSGLNMLMKSFGFDPAELMEQVEQARAGAIQMVKHFDQRLRVIEAKQDAILEALQGAGSSRELVQVEREPQWKQSA